jgi:hypothetical protein
LFFVCRAWVAATAPPAASSSNCRIELSVENRKSNQRTRGRQSQRRSTPSPRRTKSARGQICQQPRVTKQQQPSQPWRRIY